MTTDNRPDLPALESVETDASRAFFGYCVLAGFVFVYAGFMLWTVLPYWKYVSPRYLPVIVMLVALPLLVLGRVLAGDYYWRTDKRGLHCKSVLRRRTIEWTQIKSAVAPQSQLSAGSYVLRGDRFSVAIHFHLRSKSGGGTDLLAASIWQHLRRAGIANPLELPDVSESFWDSIPDAVPSSIEWQNDARWAIQSRYVWPPLFLLIALFFLYLAVDSHAKLSEIILGIIGAAFWIGGSRVLWRESMRIPLSVALTDEYVEAELLGRTVRMQWSDITKAAEVPSFNSGDRLFLVRGTKPGDEMLIPYRWQDENWGKLFLGIVHRTRMMPNLPTIAIPDYLRVCTVPPEDKVPAPQPFASPGSVELRPMWYELLAPAILFAVLFGLGAALAITRQENPPLGIVLTSMGTAGAFGILLTRTYRWKVDDAGVRKRFLRWEKLVRWEEVAFLSTVTVQRPGRRYLLLGPDRKIKLDATPDLGTKEERSQFLAIIESHMAEQQTKHPEEPSWKARPWGLDHPA